MDTILKLQKGQAICFLLTTFPVILKTGNFINMLKFSVSTFQRSAGTPCRPCCRPPNSLKPHCWPNSLIRLTNWTSAIILDFPFFHGAFFKTPEVYADRQISSTEISRFNLLQKPLKKRIQISNSWLRPFSADVSISFRLLSYLNSAAFGFSHNIETIHKAITLLGWKQLKKWLRVIILSDMGKDSESQ